MGLRWAITGRGGQLGRCLERRLRASREHTLLAAFDRDALDVGDASAVARAFEGFGAAPPDVLVNAAAFTWVDRCESEPGLAERVNAEGPAHLAEACRAQGVHLVHLSTDYVFDGRGQRPYTERDPTAPGSAYGRTKLAGERAVLAASDAFLVVRTSWLFGPGRNFLRTMTEMAAARRLAGDRTPLRVVDDQFGSPTYAADLASGLLRLVEAEAAGLYHLANGGVATWWEVARESLDRAGFREITIDRVTTAEFPRPAPRPAYSALDCGKAGSLGIRLRAWREGVAAYLASEDSPLGSSGGQGASA